MFGRVVAVFAVRIGVAGSILAGSIVARGILAGSILAGIVLAGDALAAPDAAQLKRGEDLLARDCLSCHAIDRTGASKHNLAPPFRTLSKRYEIDSLQEALAEGLVSGHPDMPEFKYDADDVGAILAYLKSIQDPR